MIKLVFLFINLFSSVIAPSYIHILEDVTLSNTKNYGAYDLVLTEEEYQLLYKEEIIATYTKTSKIEIEFCNDDLVVVVIDYDILTLQVFSHQEIIKNMTYQSLFEASCELFIVNNHVYVAGGIIEYRDEVFIEVRDIKNQEKDIYGYVDCFMMELDDNYEIANFNVFGGELIDSFSSAIYYDNAFYLVGYKDQLSGGDFGNAGSLRGATFLTKISLELEIVNFITDRSQMLLDFKIYHQEIYLCLDSNIYIFDTSLNLLRSFEFHSPLRFCLACVNYSFVTIDQAEVEIYDARLMYAVDRFYIEDGYLDVINENEEILIIYPNETKKLNFYSLEQFDEYVIYQTEVMTTNLEGTNNLELLSYDVTPNLSFAVDGIYDILYHYDGFDLPGKVEVLPEANVTNNGIYPVGYNLFFTGSAILDGKVIYNNHSVNQQGSHQLILTSLDGSLRVYNFEILDGQTSVNEYSNKNWDLEVYPNQEFCFTFNIEKSKLYEIQSIVINNQEIKNFKYSEEEQILEVRLKETIPGIYIYRLEKINFRVFNHLYTKYLHNTYTVNVLYNTLKANFNLTNNQNYTVLTSNIEDYDATIRGLVINCHNKNIETSKTVAFIDQTLEIDNPSKNEEVEVTIYLAYSEGSKFELLECAKLYFKSSDNKITIGNLEILKKGKTLEEFQINFLKNKEIEKIKIGQDVIYQTLAHNYLPAIIIGVLLSSVMIICFTFFKKIKKTKK